MQIRRGQAEGTVLANGARFIRPFGLGFIKTAGENIPWDSINQAVLWHPVRLTDFKHLVLNYHAPLLPQITPSLYTKSHKKAHLHTYPKHTWTQTKTRIVFKNVQKNTENHTHPNNSPCLWHCYHTLPHTLPCTIVSICWPGQLSPAVLRGLCVCRWRQPQSACQNSFDTIKLK